MQHRRDAIRGKYALFRDKTQIGGTFDTEKEVWEAALTEGLVADVPVADEEGGQILPKGYHVAEVEQPYDPQPDWAEAGSANSSRPDRK